MFVSSPCRCQKASPDSALKAPSFQCWPFADLQITNTFNVQGTKGFTFEHIDLLCCTTMHWFWESNTKRRHKHIIVIHAFKSASCHLAADVLRSLWLWASQWTGSEHINDAIPILSQEKDERNIRSWVTARTTNKVTTEHHGLARPITFVTLCRQTYRSVNINFCIDNRSSQTTVSWHDRAIKINRSKKLGQQGTFCSSNRLNGSWASSDVHDVRSLQPRDLEMCSLSNCLRQHSYKTCTAQSNINMWTKSI